MSDPTPQDRAERGREPAAPTSSPSRTAPAVHAPVLARRNKAAEMCDMGVSTFDRADAAGLIPAARRIGGCKVWCVSELVAWCEHGCPPRAEWEPIWRALLARRNTK